MRLPYTLILWTLPCTLFSQDAPPSFALADRPEDDWRQSRDTRTSRDREEARVARDDDRDENYIDDGLWELDFDARFAWTEERKTEFDTRTIGGQISLHHFVLDWLELGILATGANEKTETPGSDTEATMFAVAPAITLNLPTGTRVVPFVRGAAGVAYAEFEVDDENVADSIGFYWQAGAGLRFFVTHWASINVQGIYEEVIFDEGDLDDFFSYGAFAGISIFFGGDGDDDD